MYKLENGMIKRILFLLIVLVSHAAYSQRVEIDSMLKALPGAPDTAKMKLFYFIAAGYLNISNDSTSIFAGTAIQYAQKNGNKLIEAESYSLLGVVEKDKGNYNQAIIYHLKSLKIHETNNDIKEIAIAYNDLGVLYKKMRRLDEALDYYKMSNKLCRKINLSKGISMTYNNIGTIMKEKSSQNPLLVDSSLKYYQLALNEAQKTNDSYEISTCLSNIGAVYIETKMYDRAFVTFKTCLEYDKKNEDKYGMITSYLQLGNLYNTVHTYNIAILYADSAYRLCILANLRREKLDVIDLEISIEKNLGNYRSAFRFAEQYRLQYDSIINLKTSQQISELQTKYETAKKEDEITRLKNIDDFNALKIAKDQLLVQRLHYQVIGVSVLGGLGLFILFLLYNRKQLKQKQLQEKALADVEYNERMRIAKDVHDDIGAGLSKISLIAGLAQKDALTHVNYEADIDNILAVSKQLVDNMHDLVWVLNPEHTTIDHLVIRLREYCGDYFDGMGIKINMDLPDAVPAMQISREAQRNIFLTVKESLTNCIKHSGCNTITFSLKIENGLLRILITDDGKGFNVMIKTRGNGLSNMQQRIDMIGGNYTITSTVNEGCGTEMTVYLSKIATSKNTTLV
jgi:signal transduction histidine kinase